MNQSCFKYSLATFAVVVLTAVNSFADAEECKLSIRACVISVPGSDGGLGCISLYSCSGGAEPRRPRNPYEDREPPTPRERPDKPNHFTPNFIGPAIQNVKKMRLK